MELNKIRNLSDEELASTEKTSAEQLFRLRFQTSMGQNDGVKKLRELRKDIARIKTVARQRQLGIASAQAGTTTVVAKAGKKGAR
jgi:large subunit ribosomal protein L29